MLVLTHDARLVEAVRRLQIPARVFRVDRRANSAVEVAVHHHPVKAYLKDAFQLAKAEPELGKDLVRAVLPGFLRGAIEAACLETIRRRRLAAGEDHDALETLLDDVKSTNEILALALFDDPSRGNAVLGELKRRLGDDATDAYQTIRKATHGSAPFPDDPETLIAHAKKLAAFVENRA